MDYLDLNLRLQEIKREIYELRSVETKTVIDKINNLRTINRLLKEQNRLLAVKQDFTNLIKSFVDPAYITA